MKKQLLYLILLLLSSATTLLAYEPVKIQHQELGPEPDWIAFWENFRDGLEKRDADKLMKTVVDGMDEFTFKFYIHLILKDNVITEKLLEQEPSDIYDCEKTYPDLSQAKDVRCIFFVEPEIAIGFTFARINGEFKWIDTFKIDL